MILIQRSGLKAVSPFGRTKEQDPDPNFNFDADPDPNTDWHQNDADPHAYPTPSFTHAEK
jgi:hypothetical protein